MDLSDIYNKVIMQHYRDPVNDEQPDSGYQAESSNRSCGDAVSLFLKANGGTIEQVHFKAKGCIICKAAASVLVQTIKGHTVDECRQISDEVKQLVEGDQQLENQTEEIPDYQALAELSNFPTRARCGTLAWETLDKILKKTL